MQKQSKNIFYVINCSITITCLLRRLKNSVGVVIQSRFYPTWYPLSKEYLVFFLTFFVFQVSFAQTNHTIADKVLNNQMGYPNYPQVTYSESNKGFARELLTKVPPAGTHPRILFSVDDIPNINLRLQTTDVGKKLNNLLQEELNNTIRSTAHPIGKAFEALAIGDVKTYQEIVNSRKVEATSFSDRTFQNSVLSTLKLEALDCLLKNNKTLGKKVAAAITTWAKVLEPEVKQWRTSLFADDASRWGSWHALGSFELFNKHELGDAYDVCFNFMNTQQQEQVRNVIAQITNGTYTFAMKLPHQLRTWNWVNFSNCLPILALSIEGEKGYDKRVYDRGVEVMKDYILNNYSLQGSSTEAIGYTTGGWKDGVPAVLAMARRGNNLMLLDRFQSIIKWQLNLMLPFEGEWLNHGDLGNYSPGLHEVMLHKKFFPNDSITDYSYQQVVRNFFNKPSSDDKATLLELIVMACDVNKTNNGEWIDYKQGAALKLPLDFYDVERGNIVARTAWAKDAVQLNFECRSDGFYAGHEHADRGNFNIAALGRLWTPESPRSPESKYHNVVSIDGKGQGMFATPGNWLGMYQNTNVTFGVCDTKYAYDWFWPKAIVSVDTNNIKFKAERFALYRPEAVFYQKTYDLIKETHPNVTKRFEGFDLGDGGMWDEDPFTVRIKHNPVTYAYRTAGLVKGNHPYILIIDDIKKDDTVRLYEWNMMVANDLAIINLNEEDAAQNFLGPRVLARTNNFYTDIILGSDNIPHTNGIYKPTKGEPLLLVRIIQKTEPNILEYDVRPSARLETIEKKDAFSSPGIHLGPGGRTWGIAKRLVVPSRSVVPEFKVLVYPYRYGLDELPQTDFSDKSNLKVDWSNQKDIISFKKGFDGRTRLTIKQNGSTPLVIE